jgi:hypothetical protein
MRKIFAIVALCSSLLGQGIGGKAGMGGKAGIGGSVTSGAPGNFTLLTTDYSGTATGCGTSCSVTITPGGSVAAGTLIVFMATAYWTSTGTNFGTWTFTYNNGTNNYTATNSPNSPCGSNVGANVGEIIVEGYILSAVAGSSISTFKAAYTGASSDFVLDLEMIQLYSATDPIHFDKDACSNVTSNTATPIALPTISPTFTNSLLCGAAFTGAGDTSSTATGSTSPWTRGNNDNVEGQGDFYILSSSAGTTAAHWPDTVNPDKWAGVIMAFYSQ